MERGYKELNLPTISGLSSPFILPRLVFQQFLGENVAVGSEQVVKIRLCNAGGNIPNIKVGVLDVRGVRPTVRHLRQQELKRSF